MSVRGQCVGVGGYTVDWNLFARKKKIIIVTEMLAPPLCLLSWSVCFVFIHSFTRVFPIFSDDHHKHMLYIYIFV